MAAVATIYNWVKASGGVWTRIAMGPLVTGFPVQFLELAGLGAPATIGFSLDGYSAAPPFYERNTVASTSISAFSGPESSTGVYTLVIAYAVSPWAEFWLLPTK